MDRHDAGVTQLGKPSGLLQEPLAFARQCESVQIVIERPETLGQPCSRRRPEQV